MPHANREQPSINYERTFVNRWSCAALIVMALAGCASGVAICPDGECLAPEIEDELAEDGVDQIVDPPVDAIEPELLSLQTLNILTEYCAECHSYPSASGSIDYITDLGRLIDAGYIVPGAAHESELYTRIDAGEMPPVGSGPTEEEVTIIRQWINNGAVVPEEPETCDHETFTYDEMLFEISEDLIGLDLDDRPFIRYLSVHDVYNRQACDATVERARDVATKLVNSLSQNFEVTAPELVGEKELLLRLDIRDYGWEESAAAAFDLWELAALENPYALRFAGTNGETVNDMTETSFPIQTLSSFLQITSRPPLYYDFVGFPSELDTFLAELGVDIAEAQAEKSAIRAGSLESGVAFFGRLLERVNFALGRVLWISYDFDSNLGDASILNDPLNAAHVGNELIYSLPNGFNAYAITDAAGNRIDRAPVNVVVDPLQRTQEVVAGISCMSCHNSGIRPMTDVIRPYVLENSFLFQGEIEQITDLYVEAEEFQAAVDFDNANLDAVHAQAGLVLENPDGLVETSLNFERDLTLEDFAAEIGLDPDYVAKNIVVLDPELLVLASGGRVPRDVVDRVFAASLCTFPTPDFKVDDEECFEPE